MNDHVVYKYPFLVADRFTLEMPVGAQILHVECQQGMPMIWAQVDPLAAVESRQFRVVGTGHAFDGSKLLHVATFQQGPFVWHLFEPRA